MIEKYFLHVWNKIYFNIDLPKDRDQPCNLTIDTALFDFFVPTTKRKKSVSQWLGSSNKEIEHFRGLDIAKAVFLIIMDALLYVPRLALNIIKLATEVLPLTLRELAYAAFNSMVEGAEETTGISSGLYKVAASICWVFTSLFSLIYLIGGLVTSPGMTILSIMDTLNKLKCPVWLNLAIGAFVSLSVFAFHLAMIIIFAPMLLPLSVLILPERAVSWWVLGSAIALAFFDMNGLMFNNDPDGGSLFFTSKKASLSIYPLEFLRIRGNLFSEFIISRINNRLPTPPIFKDEDHRKKWAKNIYEYDQVQNHLKNKNSVTYYEYIELAAEHGHPDAQIEYADHCLCLYLSKGASIDREKREGCREEATKYYDSVYQQSGNPHKLGTHGPYVLGLRYWCTYHPSVKNDKNNERYQDDYDLVLASELREKDHLLTRGKMYLAKQDNKLAYSVLTPDNKEVKGILDIHVTGELTLTTLASLKFEILQETSNRGHTHQDASKKRKQAIELLVTDAETTKKLSPLLEYAIKKVLL